MTKIAAWFSGCFGRPLSSALTLILVSLAATAQEPSGAARAGQESDAAALHREAGQRLAAAAEACARGERERVLAETTAAAAAFERAQEVLGVDEAVRSRLPAWKPRGDMVVVGATLGEAALLFGAAAEAYDSGEAGEDAQNLAAEAAESVLVARHQDAWITGDFQVLGILMVVLAALFAANRHPRFGRIFKVVPLLVFAYFVPTIFSNTGVIPIDSPLYSFIKGKLLPMSLVLLVLAIDLPAISRLGKHAVLLFLAATATVVIGGPLAYLVCSPLVPDAMGDQAWKGLAALSGSWIGGGANFVAIGESVGASASTLSMMVVVDVAVQSLWMVVLLWFAGREKQADARIGADRSKIEELRTKVEEFEERVSRPTNLPDLLLMLAIAVGTTAVALALADVLPDLPADEPIISRFTWVALIVTTVAMVLSFTKLRELEGAGASKLGSVLLYLLVASIGAQAQFSRVLEVPSMVVIGLVWMAVHAGVLLLIRRLLRAPIFFLAVGSQANIGGAASAPIVASAFHPALAPVGILLAIGGYALGIYAGVLCATLLRWVHLLVG